jgi:hypothetical protein
MRRERPEVGPDVGKALDALIAELLRVRAEDPPMSDEEIRRVRIAGRP